MESKQTATQDEKCGTCAYRVNELRRTQDPYAAGSTMVCLHPKIGRSDCRAARVGADALCGDAAVLWAPHATCKPLAKAGAA